MTGQAEVSTVTALEAVERLAANRPGGRLNLLGDAHAAETLGRWFAAQARTYGAEIVVIWDEPQAAVLAHVVAREMNCGVVRVLSEEGLVELVDTPAGGEHGLLLADSFDSENAVRSLIGVSERAGITPAVIAAIQPGEVFEQIMLTIPYPTFSPVQGAAR
ncbi:hypothetical protein [Nonomuraea helvata]|uniref:Uncharacterized protein n=1 Tax=Nonomuraea helvata TaxID=37484 RepID=A0ABV5SCV7_9ACTN